MRGSVPDRSLGSLPGIERVRALMRGLVPRPPLSHLFGYRLTQVGSGNATLTMPVSPWFQDYTANIDVRVPAEEALAAAVLTGAPAGYEVRTVSLSVNLLRPPTIEAESLIARARTLNTGRAFTLAEVLVEDAQGRGVVHATGSFLLRPLEPAPPPLPGPLEPVEEPVYGTPDPYLRPLPAETFPFQIWDEDDYLPLQCRIVAGEFPPAPAYELFGLSVAEVSAGAVCFMLDTSGWLCSRTPEVTPGVVAALVHCGLTAPPLTLALAGQRLAIVDQAIDFLRPVPADGGRLLCQGRLIHEGDLLISMAEVTDPAGNRVAVGHQASLVVERRRGGSGGTAGARVLATVLFTDIVESTRRAGDLGDARWRELLEEHHTLVRRQVELYKGRAVKTTGDGFLATFDAPGRAVQCARAIRDSVRRLGLEVRAGLHTGECEVVGTDIAGVAVHIAARIMALAEPGEILVSGGLRDLVAGSGLRFVPRGRHELKGVNGEWEVFGVLD